jgi:hypothetical protein
MGRTKAGWVTVGPEPHLATCQRCGGTVAKPELPIPLGAAVKYFEYAVALHAHCRLEVTPMVLSGRCRDGFEADRGRVVHLVPNGEPWGRALCGAKPGRSSAYGFLGSGRSASCERCLQRRGVAR